jgi:hypothetical protein
MITRRRALRYCAIWAGAIAVRPSAVIAQHQRTSATNGNRAIQFAVVALDPKNRRILGTIPEGGAVTLMVAPDTTINGRHARSFSGIHRGDFLTASAHVDASGNLVAMNIDVNTWQNYVRITGLTSNGIAFTPLDYHTRNPRRDLRWGEGTLPGFGVLSHRAPILDRGKRVGLDSSLVGRDANVFGYKAPDSRTVRIFSMDLLGPRRRLDSAGGGGARTNHATKTF